MDMLGRIVLAVICLSPTKRIRGKTRLEKIVYLILNQLLREGILDQPPTKCRPTAWGVKCGDVLGRASRLGKDGLIEIQPVIIPTPDGPDIFETHYVAGGEACGETVDELGRVLGEEGLEIIRRVVERYADAPLLSLIKDAYLTKPDPRLIRDAPHNRSPT